MFGAWELRNPIANNSKVSEPYLALDSVTYEIGILALSPNNKVTQFKRLLYMNVF